MNVKKIIVLGLMLMIFLLCGCGKEESGVYSEQKCFTYDLYFLKLYVDGKFNISDVLCRNGQDGTVLNGTYELYESKLVLKLNDGESKLVFLLNGENWVFEESKSKGTKILPMRLPDDSVWEPTELFLNSSSQK